MDTSTFLYVLLGVAIFVIIISGKSFNPFEGKWHLVSIGPWKLGEDKRQVLSQYFPFYRSLPPRSKTIFENRVVRFIKSKNFIPRNITEVTDEMKVFISASAIQLTFGLPSVYLQHFRYILVYPDAYYSTISRHYHKGEVNPRQRAIVLSWKSFVEGYSENEGVNLGLHEMAHALHLENRIRNSEYDFLPEAELAIWDQEAAVEIETIKMGQNVFFRAYGGTDTHEFFAVAVENFFERPAKFKEHNDKLYNAMAGLLNQNPLLLIS